MKKRVRRARKRRIQNPLSRPLVVYELWPFKTMDGKQLWSVGGASGAVHVSVVDERKPAALERARLLLGAPLAAWKRAIAKHEAAEKRSLSLLAAKRNRKRPRLERRYPARGKLKTGALVIVWDKTQAKADAQLRAALKGLGGGRKLAARGHLVKPRRRKK